MITFKSLPLHKLMINCTFHSFVETERAYFTFMWRCIVTNFFIIKPTRCTNFTTLFWHETLHVSDRSSVHVYKPVWHIPLLSVQWINSWWWTEELPETCRVSCRSKFVKLAHLVGFITKKFVTMHGHIVTMHGHMLRYTVTCYDARSHERKKHLCISCGYFLFY